MQFKPNQTSFAAAPRICFCDLCKINYGSCNLFQTYELPTKQLKETALRSSSTCNEVVQTETTSSHDFLMPNSICALAADEKSHDTVWFVQIEEEVVATETLFDDYGFQVNKGHFDFQASHVLS